MTIQRHEKVTYGKAQEAKLDWRIREATKSIFKNRLDVVGQNIENIIDEHLSRNKSPVVCNVYCNSEELIIEDFIGMTPDDLVGNYAVFGVSAKSKVFGRFGHGGKDTALAIAGFFHIVSKSGASSCAYKIWEDKDLRVRFSPAWGLNYEKKENGTLIIVPNIRERFTLEDIKKYLLDNFYLGLLKGDIVIGLAERYGSRKNILKVNLPADCEKKDISIKFDKKDIEKYCTKPPLFHVPEVNGFYLVPKEGEIAENGYNVYAEGKFVDKIPSSIKGVAYLGIDFLIETTELTGSKELRLGKNTFYAKHLLPRLQEWEKNNLQKPKEAEDDRELIDEIESLLGPLWGGREKKQEKEKKRPPRLRKQPIEFQKQLSLPDSGRTPEHGKLLIKEDDGERLIVGIQLPDTVFINKGNPDGKYIWELDRKTKKTLLYSRAAIFLPFIERSKSGSLTSMDLNGIHTEALKSQEFWINAIRRDHGDKTTVRYLAGKRFVIG